MATVTLGLRRYLVQQPKLTSLLGNSAEYGPWIFRNNSPFPFENTGQSGVTLRQRGSWTTPNLHNTLEFPRVECEVYCDPPRQLGMPTDFNAEDRAVEICRILSSLLHVVDGDRLWDTVRVVSSKRMGEPAPSLVPGGDGLVYASVDFAVTVV